MSLDDEGKESVNATNVDALARVDEDATVAEIVGRGMSKKDAVLWLDVTERLRGELGRPVKPADYVAFAKSKKGESIRHLFEWDNAKAADNFRLLQAAHYCRMVRVVFSAEEAPMRAIVRVVDTSDRSGYVPLKEVHDSEFYRKQILGEAARDLRLFRVKYLTLKNYLGSADLAAAFELVEQAFAAFEKAAR